MKKRKIGKENRKDETKIGNEIGTTFGVPKSETKWKREREREKPTFFFRRLRGPSSSGGCEVATERVGEREKERVGEREKKRVGERERERVGGESVTNVTYHYYQCNLSYHYHSNA